MLKVLAERSTLTCVVARWGDRITAEQFEALGSAIDAAVAAAEENGEQASAVLAFDSMPMVADWAAFKSDMSFLRHRYGELARVAYVGDVKWIEFKVQAFGWLTKPEDRTFAADELDAAITWACGDAA